MNIRFTHLPIYDNVRALLEICSELEKDRIYELKTAFNNLKGSNKARKDWKDPDTWIPLLDDDNVRDSASNIWYGSNKKVNPRYIEDYWALVNGFELLKENENGKLNITEGGIDFVEDKCGNTVRYIDEHEGLIELLRIIIEEAPIFKKNLIPKWQQHLLKNSNIRSGIVVDQSFRHRITNLRERKFIDHVRGCYSPTDQGEEYFMEFNALKCNTEKIDFSKTIDEIEIQVPTEKHGKLFSNFTLSKKFILSICRGSYQKNFRKNLIKIHGSCMLTDVSVEDVLEACHIIPVKDGGEFSVRNGLLLRSDIHKLFDSGKILIDENGEVYLDEKLKKSALYNNLPRKINLPDEISKEFLQIRFEKII